jgi:hypothetical protein
VEESSERWLPVVGYEGYYEVSDHGRARSLDRWIEALNRWGSVNRYFRLGTVLRNSRVEQDPYARVSLSITGVVHKKLVHRLVLEAFVGPPPRGRIACHGPAGSSDNRLNNLRWDTDSANTQDLVRSGNHHLARRNICDYGHILAAPNLANNTEVYNRRRCNTCKLTTMWLRHYGYTPGDTEWLIEAARRYAEILYFGYPLNYRRQAIKDAYGPSRWQPPKSA